MESDPRVLREKRACRLVSIVRFSYNILSIIFNLLSDRDEVDPQVLMEMMDQLETPLVIGSYWN